MATRPIFIPKSGGQLGVEELMLEFSWHPGLSKTQKQKTVEDLHHEARKRGFDNILEISTKSKDDLGISLSAFNLLITTKLKNTTFSVETAFQGSKVFERGGPYKDLIGLDSRASKKDIRLKESGNLIGFEFFGDKFPLMPRTFFYDWIYINALKQNLELTSQLKKYSAFSDIEFNPSKSINCQAYSVALYVSLVLNNKLEIALESSKSFLDVTKEQYALQKRNLVVQTRF